MLSVVMTLAELRTIGRILAVSIPAGAASLFGGEVERREVDHDFVASRAESLAGGDFQPRKSDVPKALLELGYDEYQTIRFVDEESLWRPDDLPFRAQFFSPGYIFKDTVTLHEFTETHVQRIPFVRTFFDYAELDIPARLPGSIDYAGFRLLGHINAEDRWDEVISFLGGSYFRAVAKDQRFGISARGISVDTGLPVPEEFPAFVEFWLGKPAPEAKSIVVHALLDGPSLSGAFSFTISPGTTTIVDTRVTLFFRSAVENLGLAPLTSMFWFGENSGHNFGDFRPEVHDSDGLLVETADGRRRWRPLNNPADTVVTEYDGKGGFGLFQRDRAFSSYQDLEARAELRPSVWIEPGEGWPDGRVRLVELSTTNEYADNIVVFWAPSRVAQPGDRLDFSYRQHWTGSVGFGDHGGWVSATRQTKKVDGRAERTMYVVDYSFREFADIPEDATLSPEISVPDGVEIVHEEAIRNDINDSVRLAFLLEAPPGHPPVEISARLLLEGVSIAETWTTQWRQ